MVRALEDVESGQSHSDRFSKETIPLELAHRKDSETIFLNMAGQCEVWIGHFIWLRGTQKYSKGMSLYTLYLLLPNFSLRCFIPHSYEKKGDRNSSFLQPPMPVHQLLYVTGSEINFSTFSVCLRIKIR